MSRSDSVPAPMVQVVPAALLEAVDRMIAVRTDPDPAPFYEAFHEVVAARAAVDAAAPAASVPAADILALADEWENLPRPPDEDYDGTTEGNIAYGEWSALRFDGQRALRALVDAADTPRDEPKHPKFEAFKAEQLKNPEVKAAYDEAHERNAPAAPPETVCVCIETKATGAIDSTYCQIHPASVPVNDEAEAAWQAWHNVYSYTDHKRSFLAGYRQGRSDA